MYHARLITNKQEWESFVLSQQKTPFLQSIWNGDFYASLGESSWIIGVYDGKTLVGGSLVVSVHARRGNFLFVPHGPIGVEPLNPSFFTVYADCLRVLAVKEKYDFIRMSPFLPDTREYRTLFQSAGFRSAPMHMIAENSWILDISLNESEIFSGMKKNHRNLIRRCERDGVVIELRQDSKAVDILNDMLDVTEKKHGFHRFSREYVEKEFSAFQKNNAAAILVAALPDGRIDAAAMFLFYGNMAVYRHSGSLNQDKRLPTPYLLQWMAVQEAKKRGIRWYNFWGIAPPNATEAHPFFGITHFKTGFGGERMDALPAQDLPITKRYWINWAVETCRSFKRGFHS